ncbi:Hypothetical predicted protein [Paramuricea clavata]|uniref:Uncharacterized protein n=1 Tax=Paramuricea clavata TaxID=317549 RepID=A0A6S7I4S2_PARCT|nr:Hypothetical predicted protein [Paramuricea clavata]
MLFSSPGGNTTTPFTATPPTPTTTLGENTTTLSPKTRSTTTDSRPTSLPDSSTKKVDTESDNGILSELDKEARENLNIMQF